MKLSYTVTSNLYTTIKEVLKQEFHISDRLLLKLKKNEKIYKNHEKVSVRCYVSQGDLVEIFLDLPEDNTNIIPIKMNLDILYEDEAMLIVNKPAGIAIHPSNLHYTNSLSNGIRDYFEQIGLEKKVRPVNRLDKDTSGIVIFAKNEYVQECLVTQMKQNIFQKEYIAIVNGILKEKQGTLNFPISRKIDSIIERCVNQNGVSAVTHYRVIKESEDLSVVHVLLETGRTHQIRVHMAHIGHPILGDTLYGYSSKQVLRQALHAYKVCFVHPITKEKQILSTQLPKDIQKVIVSNLFSDI